MDKFHDVLEIMEILRQEMNEIATEKNVRDPEILDVSKKLDAVLNQYQMLLSKKEE